MPRPLQRCLGLLAFLICSLNLAAAEQPATGIHGTILDADTGKPLPAQITIRSTDGKYYFPRSESTNGSAVELRKERGNSREMNTTLSAHPFIVSTPPGQYELITERGKEYVPVTNQVTVTQGLAETKIQLHRWINMAAKHWYSGDTHIHRPLSEIPNQILGEDLNVAFPLSHWVTQSDTTPAAGNKIDSPVPKPEPISVDRDHLIYPLNTEFEIFSVHGKTRALGAVLILGGKTILDRGVPPVKPVAEQAHDDGALICPEKHSWGWTLAIVPLMKADLFELSNNHVWAAEYALGKWTIDMAPPYMHLDMDQNGYTEWGWIDYGFRTYYSLLNCGFKLRPTAGTGAGVHPVPMGFSRVYVNQPDGFSYANWLKELKAGNSFVTTGPMLFVKVNGQNPGHTFTQTKSKSEYHIQGSSESVVPLDRMEILMNGEVVKTLTPDNKSNGQGGYRSAIDYRVTLEKSAWLAVRVFEQRPNKRIRFAHSSPVFVEVAGQPLRPTREQIDYITHQIESEIEHSKAVLSEAELNEYREALEIYRRIQPSETGN